MRVESFEKRTHVIIMSGKEYDTNIDRILEHVNSTPNVTEYSTSFDSGLMVVEWTVITERLAKFDDLENLK